jgi:hypothetical protein
MTIVLNGTTGITTPELESAGQVTSNGLTTSLYPLISGTAVASTSGTSIDFTGIPSWVKRITVLFSGVSTNGSSIVIVQLGDSGGIEATGYLGACVTTSTGPTISASNFSASFLTSTARASTSVSHGSLVLTALNSSNTWVANGIFTGSDAAYAQTLSGSKALSNTLDRIRITTGNGTDTFDAGTINILYE